MNFFGRVAQWAGDKVRAQAEKRFYDAFSKHPPLRTLGTLNDDKTKFTASDGKTYPAHIVGDADHVDAAVYALSGQYLVVHPRQVFISTDGRINKALLLFYLTDESSVRILRIRKTDDDADFNFTFTDFNTYKLDLIPLIEEDIDWTEGVGQEHELFIGLSPSGNHLAIASIVKEQSKDGDNKKMLVEYYGDVMSGEELQQGIATEEVKDVTIKYAVFKNISLVQDNFGWKIEYDELVKGSKTVSSLLAGMDLNPPTPSNSIISLTRSFTSDSDQGLPDVNPNVAFFPCSICCADNTGCVSTDYVGTQTIELAHDTVASDKLTENGTTVGRRNLFAKVRFTDSLETPEPTLENPEPQPEWVPKLDILASFDVHRYAYDVRVFVSESSEIVHTEDCQVRTCFPTPGLCVYAGTCVRGRDMDVTLDLDYNSLTPWIETSGPLRTYSLHPSSNSGVQSGTWTSNGAEPAPSDTLETLTGVPDCEGSTYPCDILYSLVSSPYWSNGGAQTCIPPGEDDAGVEFTPVDSCMVTVANFRQIGPIYDWTKHENGDFLAFLHSGTIGSGPDCSCICGTEVDCPGIPQPRSCPWQGDPYFYLKNTKHSWGVVKHEVLTNTTESRISSELTVQTSEVELVDGSFDNTFHAYNEETGDQDGDLTVTGQCAYAFERAKVVKNVTLTIQNNIDEPLKYDTVYRGVNGGTAAIVEIIKKKPSDPDEYEYWVPDITQETGGQMVDLTEPPDLYSDTFRFSTMPAALTEQDAVKVADTDLIWGVNSESSKFVVRSYNYTAEPTPEVSEGKKAEDKLEGIGYEVRDFVMLEEF